MKNFIILMAFTLLAFGSLFYVLSLYSGEDFTGMFSAISGDYKKRTGSSFLTNAEEGGRIAPPTRTGNCPMSTREGRLIVNAPEYATVRILYAETGAELECRTGSFTKNICRSQFKIKAYKPDSVVFEKTIFLGAGQIATVDVELKPGNNDLLPCEGAVSEATSSTDETATPAQNEIAASTEDQTNTAISQTETPASETTPENTPLVEQQSTPIEPETSSIPQEVPVGTASVEQSQTTQTPESSTVEATPTDVPLQEPTPSEETNSESASA